MKPHGIPTTKEREVVARGLPTKAQKVESNTSLYRKTIHETWEVLREKESYRTAPREGKV